MKKTHKKVILEFYEVILCCFSYFLFLIHNMASVETIIKFNIYKYKTISLSYNNLFKIPAMYPKMRTSKKARLFPFVDFDLKERMIENGHAAPKQSSMIASKILNAYILLLMCIVPKYAHPFYGTFHLS